MRRNIFGFDNARVFLWIALAVILFLGVIALGAVFQSRQSETWLSIPSLWFFSLIVLPVLMYGLVQFFWTNNDKVR